MSRYLTRRGFLHLAGAGVGAAVLTACAPATSKPTEAPKPTEAGQPVEATAAPEQPTASAEKISMTVVVTGTPEDMQANFEPFVAQHPNYDLKIIGTSWDEYDDKVNLLIAGGDTPAVWGPFAKRGIEYHVLRGVVPDIMPYIEKENYDFSDFFDIKPDGTTIRGGKYGIAAAAFPTLIVYNKQLFSDASVPVPPSDWNDKSWTWDDFVARAQKLTKPAEDPMNTVWGFDSGWDRRYCYLNFGVDIFRPEDYDTWEPKTTTATTPEFKWTLQMQHDFIWKYKFEPSPEQSSAYAAVVPQGSFFSSKAAMSNGVSWTVASLKDVEFEYALAPYPVNQYGGYRGLMYLNPWSMLKVKNQDAAWELLKFTVSVEGMEKAVELSAAGRDNGFCQGGIPVRKSVAPKQLDAMAAHLGKDVSLVQPFFEAMSHTHIFPAATPAWAEMWDVAFQPYMDQILMDKITVDEAVVKMEAKAEEILATVKW